MRARAIGICCLTLIIGLAGCGGKKPNTVRGSVTYDGQPVAKGFITFFPKDTGPTRGAAIVDGQFTIVDVPPGRRRAVITAEPVAHLRPSAAGRRATVWLAPPAVPIPANAVGNGQEVQVAAGDQTIDFHLQRVRR